MWCIAENNIQPTRQELSCDGVDISVNQRNWIDMLVRSSSVPTLPSAILLFRSGKNHDFSWGLYDCQCMQYALAIAHRIHVGQARETSTPLDVVTSTHRDLPYMRWFIIVIKGPVIKHILSSQSCPITKFQRLHYGAALISATVRRYLISGSYHHIGVFASKLTTNVQGQYNKVLINIKKKTPQMKTVGVDRDLCEVRVSRGGIKFEGSPSVTSLYNLHPTPSPVYSGIHVQPRRRLLWRPDYVLSCILREGQGHDIE